MSTNTSDQHIELANTILEISTSLNVNVGEFVSDDGKTLDVKGLSEKLQRMGIIQK